MYLPTSTYRVQLNDHFTLNDLETILPYLHRLGISTIYASPLTTALKGSQHGYDVTDPLVLNPEIGTEKDWQRVTATRKRYGIGWVQDIVPNHMAYETSNTRLYDVLLRGRDSKFFDWFDILNDPPVRSLGHRLMAPFLGGPIGECLEKGELSLKLTQKGFVIRYFDKEFPVTPGFHDWILEAGGAANINSRPDLLGHLLQNQPYILTDYHDASAHINYRRFFAVNSLIGLSMEKPAVFDAWHARLHDWHGRGWIDGLRIDHVDGLADPKTYFQRLKRLFGEDCYIVVEKILASGESLPADWPVQGTTGYEALADISQLLTDVAGSQQLVAFYREKVTSLPAYDDLVYQRKLSFLQRNMGGEWENLFHRLRLLPGASGLDQERLKQALGVWMASFSVYRAYPDAAGVSKSDHRMFCEAFDRAGKHEPDLLPELRFLSMLPEQEQARSFLLRLMQFTGPLAAKGIEDTVFYVYNPYIAHCEVGDSPAQAGITPAEFHRRMQRRQASQPHSLNASTTHDTKRGEDARIRLNYLSAIPREWTNAVTQWRGMNETHLLDIGGRRAPSPNDEYLIYQALLGAWPEDGLPNDSFQKRFAGYLTKALREADTETHYTDPDEAYERQCLDFSMAILRIGGPFLGSFVPFAQNVLHHSSVYSLSQLLLKTTIPGIPDIYQGSELWETSLVDPDNRLPVDYALRTELLSGIEAGGTNGAAAMMEIARRHRTTGGKKLYTLYRSLAVRNRFARVFAEGDYIPLDTEGPLLAFLRRHEQDWILVAAPLIRYGTSFPTPVAVILPPTAPDDWTDAFTGESLRGRTLRWPRGLVSWPVVLAIAR